jgi:hypothetical protein
MTDEQRGKYILLLCLQHQKGYLSEKDMLSVCKTYDKDIYEKFIHDGDNFYNERMKIESNKRREYSESRSNNRKSKKKICKTYDKHMENENEDINNINNVSKKPPTKEDVINYFKEKGYKPELGTKAWESYDVANWHDSNGKKIRNWKQKMIQVWFKDEHKLVIKPQDVYL